MSSAFAVGEITFGPTDVFVLPSGGSEVLLGHTEEGAVATIENRWADIVVDEHGDSPVNRIWRGQVVTVEIIGMQFDNSQLLKAWPGSVENTGTTINEVTFGRQAGVSGLATSPEMLHRLRLHPASITPDSDEGQDFIVHRANVVGTFVSRWTAREPRRVGFLFGGLIDTTKTDGNFLGQFRTAD